ncbi:efflux RND transporter periplasmic adaptor subunit [Chitinivorax sp. B]|uniref:efflux RND transporter periplasmic adaptor subunit n=1 Tax=Chitinivorax sp. B TaxID=2502235 RepID=UPI0010F7E20E|nr:efflux RND transporter periplasmic adaptor subunit [Chitinivorax sp. B]
MNNKLIQIALLMTVICAAGGTGYWLAQSQARDRVGGGKSPTETATQGQDRPVRYWYDPMVPNQHFDKPGKSPFMDMQLVPKYADEGGEAATVKVDARIMQNLGIRLAKVERTQLAPSIDVAASVAFNDRDVAMVQARSNGFVERVYGRAPGDVVVAGAPLADVLIPEWTAAQTEFLALARYGDKALVEAARQRLRLTGMPAGLIAQVERSGQVHAVTTLSTPIDGVIQTLEVRAGMTLNAGMTLAKVNGLSSVWVEAAVPEILAGQLQVGQVADVQLTAYPGERVQGKVIAILPEVNIDNRTLRVRVELANPKTRFKPGMYAQLRLAAGAGQATLLVPSEAVIRTGLRNVVMTALDGGRFQPVEVELGREIGGKTEVLQGLQEGQQVVASGQFLIDSEASLSGVMARLSKADDESRSVPVDQPRHHGIGRIEALSDKEITLSHEAIPSVGWGAMTMPFKLVKPGLAQGLKVGDRVKFDFTAQDDRFVIQQFSQPGAQP